MSRLSDIVAAKILAAIEALPILDTERKGLDWEIWPQRCPPPDGSPGMITIYIVALLGPAGPGQHVVQDAILWDPYYPQAYVNNLMRELLAKVHAEQAEALKMPGDVPAAEEPKSTGGLIIPGS